MRALHGGNALPPWTPRRDARVRSILAGGNAFPAAIIHVDRLAPRLVSARERCDVPRHSKDTKIRRDRGMIRGLRACAKRLGRVSMGKGATVDPEEVVAMYQEHLAALLRANEKEAEWKAALAVERRIEAALKPQHLQMQRYLEGVFGPDSPELRAFDLKPRKTPVVRIETKRRAVEKRRETRRMRKTMGKRQRRKLKG